MVEILAVSPTKLRTLGGELVRIFGRGFSREIAVRIGDARAEVIGVRMEGSNSVCDVRAPELGEGSHGVSLQNLDDGGNPVPGEEAFVRDAVRFVRPRLADESNLTRLVRAVRRKLSRDVIANTTISVSLDYQKEVEGDVRAVYMAELPGLVLSGPTLRPSHTYRTNEPRYDVVDGAQGPEFRRRTAPLTHDIEFSLTGASRSTAELLNLMKAVSTFFNGEARVTLLRDPHDESGERVSWELETEGEFRTTFDDPSGTRAFQLTFLILGFDTDEGIQHEPTREVDEVEVEAERRGTPDDLEIAPCP